MIKENQAAIMTALPPYYANTAYVLAARDSMLGI